MYRSDLRTNAGAPLLVLYETDVRSNSSLGREFSEWQRNDYGRNRVRGICTSCARRTVKHSGASLRRNGGSDYTVEMRVRLPCAAVPHRFPPCHVGAASQNESLPQNESVPKEAVDRISFASDSDAITNVSSTSFWQSSL